MHSGLCLPVIVVLLLAGFARGEHVALEKRILVHGHRGSRGTHPENTIPAFEEALEAGAEVLELDLQLTREGVPVIWHDSEIQPTICSHPKITSAVAIPTLTVQEIKQFDCGNTPQPRFPDQKRIPGTRISTLAEFFDWALKKSRTVHFNIETKMTGNQPKLIADPDKFAGAIVPLFKKLKIIDRVIVQSFDFRTLTAVKRLEERLRTSALFEKNEATTDYCNEAQKIKAQFISPQFDLLDAATVIKCAALGIQAAPWTLNSATEWERAVSIRVDGIITDFPRKLRLYLSKMSAQ